MFFVSGSIFRRGNDSKLHPKPVSSFSIEVRTTWGQEVWFSSSHLGFCPSAGSLRSVGPAGGGRRRGFAVSVTNRRGATGWSHGVEPRRSAPSSSPSHLPRSRLPRTCASPALRLVQPLPARAGGRGLGLTSREIASRGRRRCSGPLTGGVCAAALFGCYAVAWETGCA